MCPLRWFWIRLPGTRRLTVQHYTHARFLAQFEIFIPWICFFDAPFLVFRTIWPVNFWNGSLCPTYAPAYNAVRHEEDSLTYRHD
jgi:hypothetical protein